MPGKRENRRIALVLVALLVVALFLARHVTRPGSPPPEELPTYTAREAGGHVGEHARVCGTVVDAAYVPTVGGEPTFLNLEEPHPEPVFTALIWGDDRPRFGAPPERAFRGRHICVTGEIESHEGRAEIVVRRPGQIRTRRDGR